MEDPAVKALAHLCELHGGWKAVGLTIGVNPATVYQIVTGRLTESGTPRGVGRKLRESLERHYPGWMQLATHDAHTGQTITPLTAGEAQPMIRYATRMAPPRIGWEALMTSDDLPGEFETELPDNAMAPEAPRGARCIFLRGVAPEPGDWVLLRDADGTLYCREYRALRGGQWRAHALNPAFLPLDSATHGLQVLAVFDGMRGRKALHT